MCVCVCVCVCVCRGVERQPRHEKQNTFHRASRSHKASRQVLTKHHTHHTSDLEEVDLLQTVCSAICCGFLKDAPRSHLLTNRQCLARQAFCVCMVPQKARGHVSARWWVQALEPVLAWHTTACALVSVVWEYRTFLRARARCRASRVAACRIRQPLCAGAGSTQPAPRAAR